VRNTGLRVSAFSTPGLCNWAVKACPGLHVSFQAAAARHRSRAEEPDLVHVSEREPERLVHQDAGHIRKAHQAVVREHRAQAHRPRVQQRLVRLLCGRRQLQQTYCLPRRQAVRRMSARAGANKAVPWG
jgi:hypothetical protein